MCLQVVQNLLELLAGLPMQALPHQEGKFVGILARSWDTHCAWPVVVKMGQLVRQLLEMVWLQARSVLDDVVAGWIDCALPDRLRDKEEIISLRQGYHIVNHCPTRWIGRLPSHLEEPCVDPLAGNDLVLHHVGDLSITNTVPVHNDPGWKVPVDLGVLSEGLGYCRTHVVVQLLSRVSVQVGHTKILGEGAIHACNDSAHRPSLLSTIMIGVVSNHHRVLQGDFDSPRLTSKLR